MVNSMINSIIQAMGKSGRNSLKKSNLKSSCDSILGPVIKIQKWFWALGLMVLISACAENKQPGIDGQFVGILSEEEERALPLKVVDLQGKPISGAQVLVGQGVGQPFASNFVTTDQQGSFQAPAGWTSPQIVTVGAKGFVRASYFGQKPKGQVFQLRTAPVAVQKELKGQGTGFVLKDNDNLVDFALMMPAAKKQDLFAFNLAMFISSQVDIITVYGQQLPVPSNVALPKQKERYGFFPVTLEKPVYRLYFDFFGQFRIATIRGQFPFKQVVDQMQSDKPFVDLINEFSLKGGSVKEVNLTQPSQNQDFPVNELAFDQPRAFRTPTFSQENFLLAVALHQVQDQFMPTDFKNVPSGVDYRLNTIAGTNPQLLVVLKKKAEKEVLGAAKISAAFVPFQQGAAPVLLPMIENPHVVHALEFRAQAPSAPNGISPVATYAVLSQVQKKGQGKQASETLTQYWEAYADGWQNDFKLPDWPVKDLPEGLKRWEISFIGNQGEQKAIALEPRILENVSHATHSASDF